MEEIFTNQNIRLSVSPRLIYYSLNIIYQKISNVKSKVYYDRVTQGDLKSFISFVLTCILLHELQKFSSVSHVQLGGDDKKM